MWLRKTVRRAACSPVPSAKQRENQGVDPGCDWAVGVGLRSDSGACS